MPSTNKSTASNSDTRISKDGGWAWVVCCASFVVHVILGGLMYSFGIIFVEIMDHYKSNKADTAWIFSILQGIANFGGPLNAMLINRFGCRLVSSSGSLILFIGYMTSLLAGSVHFLYFTFGILGGFGNGCVYLSSIVSLSEHFDKKRSIATGIAVSGVGVGTFAFGPLTHVLITSYTWKGAILIQAAITFNCLACSLVYPPKHIGWQCRTKSSHKHGENDIHQSRDLDCSEQLIHSVNGVSKSDIKDKEVDCDDDDDIVVEINGESNGAVKAKTTKEIKVHRFDTLRRMVLLLQSVPFVIVLLSILLNYLGHAVPFMYIVDTARQSGIEMDRSAWFVSTIGIGNTLGRFTYGVAGNFPKTNKGLLYSTSLLAAGIISAFVPMVTSFELLICLCGMYGFILGGVLTLCLVLVVDIVGVDRSSDALGLYCLACGIALFLGPPTAGWLFDVSGSYQATYLFSAVTLGLAGLLTSIVPCCRKKDLNI